MKSFSLIFVVLFSVTAVYPQNVGESCIDHRKSPGICKGIYDCPPVLAEINKGVSGPPPIKCGWSGRTPVVCCKNSPPQSSRQPGEISRQKCKEYADYVYELRYPPIPLPNAKPTREFECKITVIPLIVGGTKAGYKEFPHMALIGYKDGNDIHYNCGGSIISEKFILTAAHCIESQEYGVAAVAAIGMMNLKDRSRQVVNIVETIYHPDYTPSSRYNDIGLLRFEGGKMNSGARPACLFTNRNVDKQNALASGWGAVGFTAEKSLDLLKVKLELFDNPSCNYTYRRDYGTAKLRNGIIDDTQLCAGSRKEIKDTCQGDSGGPLQLFHDEKDAKCMYDLIGITSFGKACGLVKNLPGVYTRISAYVKWIEDNVWPA